MTYCNLNLKRMKISEMIEGFDREMWENVRKSNAIFASVLHFKIEHDKLYERHGHFNSI